MMRVAPRLLAVLAVCLALAAGTASAEPYLAVQQGYACSACHVNPTGGGLRNDFGVVFAQNVMPATGLPDGVPAWTGRVGEFLRLGGDLRGRRHLAGDALRARRHRADRARAAKPAGERLAAYAGRR